MLQTLVQNQLCIRLNSSMKFLNEV
uniref:Uncharacterized protein n=1 Tax=Rhizophora mucronata TaxID=61149 RepID=A0A2P2QWV9_RHIMU